MMVRTKVTSQGQTGPSGLSATIVGLASRDGFQPQAKGTIQAQTMPSGLSATIMGLGDLAYARSCPIIEGHLCKWSPA